MGFGPAAALAALALLSSPAPVASDPARRYGKSANYRRLENEGTEPHIPAPWRLAFLGDGIVHGCGYTSFPPTFDSSCGELPCTHAAKIKRCVKGNHSHTAHLRNLSPFASAGYPTGHPGFREMVTGEIEKAGYPVEAVGAADHNSADITSHPHWRSDHLVANLRAKEVRTEVPPHSSNTRQPRAPRAARTDDLLYQTGARPLVLENEAAGPHLRAGGDRRHPSLPFSNGPAQAHKHVAERHPRRAPAGKDGGERELALRPRSAPPLADPRCTQASPPLPHR